MNFKESKLYSIATLSCPRCHTGHLFINKNPYKISGWDKMHTDCTNCGLHYEREPGFFQGAMYVSYGLGVAFSTAMVLINLLIGFDVFTFFVSNTIGLIVFAPLLFRYSRAIYLNVFIKYRKEKPSVSKINLAS
jgi:uncharacterized protein (DUF983 family)